MESTGEGGLISEPVRTALERGLEAGMTSHLGYGPGDWAGKEANGSANSRNGSYPKALATEVGPVTIQVPRDREGSFTPGLVPKCSGRLGGLDGMIIGLYAAGMTVRDIASPRRSARNRLTRRYRRSPTPWPTWCPDGGSVRWTGSTRSCAWTRYE